MFAAGATDTRPARCSGTGWAKLDTTTMGKHRLVPLSWVDFVDEKVHLNLDHKEAERFWQTD